jgi:hypothetical protein
MTGVLWVNIPGSNSPSITHTWPQTTTNGAIRVKTISPWNCNEQTLIYLITTMGALPVELLYFDGTAYDKTNYLEWATATEHNSSHFIVEKSEDGYEWTSIGQQWAAINSTQEIRYDLVDNEVYPVINYYRLKQMDVDGKISFSPTRAILFNNNSLVLKSNIVYDRLELYCNQATPLSINIYNASGQQCMQSKIVGYQTVALGKLAAGLYFIKSSNGETVRFVKK